jgi:hydrogenase maturation protein HypF
MEAVRACCVVSEEEASLLVSAAAPIVLLQRKQPSAGIAESVAPQNPWLGVMLPSNPLHYLLMQRLGSPVVATSGNRADEPICTDEREALSRLKGIADVWLSHDRPIARSVDDSVVRMVAGRPLILRRARGCEPPSRLSIRPSPPRAVAAVAEP